MSKYSITESRHGKKGIDIWLVKPTERLDMTTYKKVESQIKIIGGYYSRFVRAFVFETKPNIEKLNEIFGDTSSISETASQAGVSKNKVALIKLGSQNHTSIDKRTLRNEYNDRKLLVTKYRYFNGMNDSTEYIPESEWDWSDRDSGFEREFEYSSKPYLSGDYIVMGDYKAKYKSDIVQPITVTSNLPKSYNFYVDIDHDNVPNKDNPYELNRIDSDKLDIADGTRVVMSLYGNKYCGKVVKKEIRQYAIRSWNQSQAEIRSSVYYDVLLDNGVKQSMASFKVDTDNECDELAVPAILQDSKYLLPENFWSSKIIDTIKGINSIKRQKAARKKAEYARQDQQWIDKYEDNFNKNAALWLGWEMENMEYARHITGESEEQQSYRMGKWQTELMIKPISTVEPKPVEEIKVEETIAAPVVEVENEEETLQTRSDFMDELDEMDLWKEFDGRYYRKFNIPNDDKARGFMDNGIKERLQEKDGRVIVILSVKGRDEADRVSLEFMETYPLNDKAEEIARLKKQIANGERLMANPNFTGDVTKEINRYKEQLMALEQSTQEAKDNLEQVSNDEKPIRIMGNERTKVYYETDKLRLNDWHHSEQGKYILIVYDREGSLVPSWNYYFDNLKTAMEVAKKIDSHFPNGVPSAVLLDKVVDEYIEEIEQGIKPIYRKLRKLISILNNQ